MHRFIICIQNHDQIGNRAMGERVHHQVDMATWRAMSLLLLTSPMTPLLFMGQEWAASTPFLFFTDMEPGLGRLVTAGRRREFKDFPEFSEPGATERIPDPQSPATFEASRMRWSERDLPGHAAALRLYRRLLGLRRAEPALQASADLTGEAYAQDDGAIVVRRWHEGVEFWAAVRLRGVGGIPIGAWRQQEAGTAVGWETVLTTEDPDVAVDAAPIKIEVDDRGPIAQFSRPGGILLKVVRSTD